MTGPLPSFKKLDIQLETLHEDKTVGEKSGNRFPLAGVFSWRILQSWPNRTCTQWLHRKEPTAGLIGQSRWLPDSRLISENLGNLRSPRQMTQAGACILTASEACPSKSSQLFPETGFYFFSSWRLCLCLVGGLFLLIYCFILEFGHGMYYISYRTNSAHGDRRKTQKLEVGA